MRSAFVHIPNLEGHRQIYVRMLCDYFFSRDFRVTVASDLSGLDQYAELESLRRDARVSFVSDTWSGEASRGMKLRGLTTAARRVGADVTFLAEADPIPGVLAAQLTHPWLRLPGRRVALFIRNTKYVHQTSSGHMRERLFHEFVVQRLPVLEAVLAVDEVFVEKHDGRYVWLPDIAVRPAESGVPDPETVAWEAELSTFLAAHQGRPVVVYVGMPQARRNYEHLLELACDIDGCFVHCGALHDPDGYPYEDPAPRRELVSRSAILESGRFYQSFETARVTLSAARSVVLPYDAWHLMSSGVMLQALMADRPVLVPDRGLMGWRVRNFELGLTFVPDDREDMRRKFMMLEDTPPGAFAAHIEQFLEYFTRAQFESAMDVALGLGSAGPRVPRRPSPPARSA